MIQNTNDDYSKYFEALDTAIDKLVSIKKQYIENPNRSCYIDVNCVNIIRIKKRVGFYTRRLDTI